MTLLALRILVSPSACAYSHAAGALHADTRASWEDYLSRDAEDYDKDEAPYRADAEGLKRFLEAQILPWYVQRRRELDHRPLIRAQAFGDAVDLHKLERLGRYETYLDRKLERTLAVLLRLKDLRRETFPG